VATAGRRRAGPAGRGLRKGKTRADLAGLLDRHDHGLPQLCEVLALLAAMAPTLTEAIEVARSKAYVTLDGTLLRIDRVGMVGGRGRPYYSGCEDR